MKIQDFINNRHKYKVDRAYQRPADAWSKEDNQCLIDTILRSEPMPISTKFLCIVVKVITDDNFIITVYYTDSVKRGELLWEKK